MRSVGGIGMAVVPQPNAESAESFDNWLEKQSDEFRTWFSNRRADYQNWFAIQSPDNRSRLANQSEESKEYRSWLSTVSRCGFYLQRAPAYLKMDKQIVLEAVRNDCKAFRWASPDLQLDNDVMLAASQNGGAEVVFDVLKSKIQSIPSDSGMSSNQERIEVEIKVFQSSPLALIADDNGEPCLDPQQLLDFDHEENILKKASEEAQKENHPGADIRFQFEVGTKGSVNKFVSDKCKMFHFSGHGTKEFLLLENSYGGGDKLVANGYLEEWIRKGGFQFAFVAACDSAGVGDAICKGGVPHVIGTKASVSHEACAVFAHWFYYNLAINKTIENAFYLAKDNVRLSGEISNPEKEAEHFVLLPAWRRHDVTLRDIASRKGPNHGRITNEVPSHTSRLATASYEIPSPPKTFVGRELDMYKTLEPMNSKRGEQLVFITGDAGTGKKSFGKAIGHYMKKRRSIWGEVYWIQGDGEDSNNSLLSHVIQKYSTSTTDSDETWETGVVIIDATKIKEGGRASLQQLVRDLLAKSKTKLIFIHRKGVSVLPEAEYSSCTRIELKNLELEPALILFGSCCKHVKDNPHSWSHGRMYKRCKQYPNAAIKILGEGNPKRLMDVGTKMDRPHYKKFIGQADVDDFRQVIRYLYPSRHDEQCVEELFRSTGAEDNTSNPRPQIRSWQELEAQFTPILWRHGLIYRKKVSSYIGPVKKGDIVENWVDGKLDSRKEVPNDKCRVVCSMTGEKYVLTEAEFEDSYDASSKTAIPVGTDEHLQRLSRDGYFEYRSKRYVRAIEVRKDDMKWFRHGINSSSGSVYEPPWGGTDEIKEGDYVVMRHKANSGINDGVYRIERDIFNATYCKSDEMEPGEGPRAWAADDVNVPPGSSTTTAGDGEETLSSRISRMEHQMLEIGSKLEQILEQTNGGNKRRRSDSS